MQLHVRSGLQMLTFETEGQQLRALRGLMNRNGYLKRFTGLNALTIVIAVLALFLRASPASAQTCVGDVFGKKVQCTANDVRIAQASNPRHLDGSPFPTCDANSTISFIATFHVVTSSTSSRSNIGMYFAANGQADAITGTCSDNIISPTHSINSLCTGSGTPFSFCTGNMTGTSTIVLGSSGYQELDPLESSPTGCGDTTATSAIDIDVKVDNVLCQAAPGTNPPKLLLPECTSWQVPGQTNFCQTSPPNFLYPAAPAAAPGTPSKCDCGNLIVPITVQQPGVTVAKSCTTSDTPGLNTSCTLSPEGGSVTYTVDVTNTSNAGSVELDQICDTAYGNIATKSGFTPACAAGSKCAAPNNVAGTTCATNITCAAGGSIAKGSDYSCTFAATQGEATTVTDTASASGVGSSSGTTFGPTSSNSVSVVSGEAASTATTSKTLDSTQAGCATVRHAVSVHNSSGADEVLTLSAFSDNPYGDITKFTGTGNASVLGTTCGVATNGTGLGTLSGTAGGGTLPATLTVGGTDYSCKFDAEFCGSLSTVTRPDGTTCLGIQHTDTVTPTLVGDEGEAVTNTGGTLVVTECFSAFSQ